MGFSAAHPHRDGGHGSLGHRVTAMQIGVSRRRRSAGFDVCCSVPPAEKNLDHQRPLRLRPPATTAGRDRRLTPLPRYDTICPCLYSQLVDVPISDVTTLELVPHRSMYFLSF